jgi:hypothetical protein
MRKFFIIVVIFLTALSIYDIAQGDKFKESRQQVAYSLQCSDVKDSKDEVIICKDGKQYRKSGTKLVPIE